MQAHTHTFPTIAYIYLLHYLKLNAEGFESQVYHSTHSFRTQSFLTVSNQSNDNMWLLHECQAPLTAAVVHATVDRIYSEGGKNRAVMVACGFLWKWNSYSLGNCFCNVLHFLLRYSMCRRACGRGSTGEFLCLHCNLAGLQTLAMCTFHSAAGHALNSSTFGHAPVSCMHTVTWPIMRMF